MAVSPLDTETGDTGDEPGVDPSDGVVTQVGPAQQEMRAIRQEVMAAAEAECWDHVQVQAEIQRRQQERIGEAVDAFRLVH